MTEKQVQQKGADLELADLGNVCVETRQADQMPQHPDYIWEFGPWQRR